MSFIVENISGAQLDLNDIGISLITAATLDLTTESSSEIVAASAASGGDLNTLVTAGSLVVKDPIDGVTNLSIAEGIIALASMNDPHWRLGAGSRIGDLSDVDLTGESDTFVLQFDVGSGNYIVISPSTLAGDMAFADLSDTDMTGIANTDILQYNGSNWAPVASTTLDQNLWQTIAGDSGSAVANTTTDTFTIAGGTGITTAVVGDTITITASAAASGDLPSVVVANSATSAILLTWTNVTWDTTHLENDSGVVEHNNTNTDRISIKETGLYIIAFSMSFNADALEEQIDARILIDDTTVVPGSLRKASEDDEINDLSNTITAELIAGTYLTFQVQANGTGNVLDETTNFMVTRARGTKGDTGATGTPGSGTTLVIKDEGINLANTPHTAIDFVGASVTAVDGGSGVATVTVTGGVTITTINSEPVPTFVDSTRSNKVLSVSEVNGQWSSNKAGNGDYLRIGSANNSKAADVMPLDATIVRCATNIADNKGSTSNIDLYVNDILNTAGINTVTGSGVQLDFDASLNIDVNQGDRLHLRASVSPDNDVVGVVSILYIRWRGA